jgi:NAD+ kinase
MIQSTFINMRPDDESALPLIKDLVEYLELNNIEIMMPLYDILATVNLDKYSIDTIGPVKTDLVITIGGDGTFLRTARQFADTSIPIFGINRGTLGFLTEFNPHEYKEHLKNVLQDNFTTSERAVMEAHLIDSDDDPKTSYFINDAVISKGALSRPISLELEIDDMPLNSFSGDGLIVATATGSTAYSLSAGGPIILPIINNIYLINPVCPHSLAMRPMVVPSNSNLTVKITSPLKNLLLTIDGQEAIHIEENDKILICNTEHKIRIITHPQKSYYHILREKLKWG